jgi:hypothetical protein
MTSFRVLSRFTLSTFDKIWDNSTCFWLELTKLIYVRNQIEASNSIVTQMEDEVPFLPFNTDGDT